ncbi:hypothetical protein KR084_012871 [Drosophila pseudotakahashii]|nr:hypothetical protein KR084_012871 [Drosophila pseudotakahashii]
MTLKDLNGRLARWSLALQAYDFQIEHRKGKDNVVADMLSRIPEVEAIEVFDFETIEFENPEYLERIQTVKENAEHQKAPLCDAQIQSLSRTDRLQLIREKVTERINETYERSAKQYNRRAKEIRYLPGQEIFKRNFILSDFKNNINAKFCRKYSKCRIVRPVGNNLYELETLQGKRLGVFHAKDLKQ